jgi:predicted nucleotidyltransferase
MDERLSRLRRALSDYPAERRIVFGSVARGDWHEASDIDLLLVCETDQPFFERLREVYRLLPPDLGVEVLVYTPAEVQRMTDRGNGFLGAALREGREL